MATAYRVPDVAMEVGLGKRFRYWVGRSDQSYLFTRIDIVELADFPTSVGLIARGSEILAAGLGGDLAATFQEAKRGHVAYVHLLNTSKADGLKIIDDLDPDALQPCLELFAA